MPDEIEHRPKVASRGFREFCGDTLQAVIDAISNRLLSLGIAGAATQQAAKIHAKTLEVNQEVYASTIRATREAKEQVAEGDKNEEALFDLFSEGLLAQTKLLTQMLQAGIAAEPDREALERPTDGSRSLPSASPPGGEGPRRKVGRPPKWQTSPSEQIPLKQHAPEMERQEETEEPKPRKRGRPRKQVEPETQN